MGIDKTLAWMYLTGASGGGGGGGGETKSFAEEWDFTSETPKVGKINGITCTSSNVAFSSDGATYDSTSDFISFGNVSYCKDLFHNITYSSVSIEVKVKSMSLTSGSNRRFIMGSTERGLVYRNTGLWGFYSSGWEEFSETSGDFFDGATVKVIVDSNSKWKIYKNGTLLWEPTSALALSALQIGSSGTSINNAVIEWAKITAVVA